MAATRPPTGPDAGPADQRLDEVVTQWTLLAQAHRGDDATSLAAARAALVLRYARPIRAYLGALLRDDESAADEVAQDVVVRMLQGGLASAAAAGARGKGRFRDYLKVTVRNAALGFLRARRRGPTSTPDGLPEPAAAPEDDPLEARWLDDCRRSLLDGAWAALEEEDRRRRDDAGDAPAYARILRLSIDHPEAGSVELAGRLSTALGRTVRPDAFRKQLSRARQRFAELLLDQIALGLDDPDPQALRRELDDLGLTPFLRDQLPDEPTTWRQRA